MRAMLPTAGEAAISAGVKSDADSSIAGEKPAIKTSGVKSDASERGWFADLAQALLPGKPGTALHFITGYDERLCQKYAAGDVKPSAHFLRILLRSEQGGQFFAALMHGCEAEWWREHKRDADLAAAGRRFIAEITKRQ